MTNETVYSFPKNENEEVRFSLREYKGELYVDFRIWFQARGGEFRPTKKGLTLSAGHFGQVVNGIEKISELLTVKGGAL